MDFGFIQLTAPASQPVPPGDATASPDAFKDAAAAFDAALSETLSAAGAGAVKTPAASNVARPAQPAWMLASLFTATLTGSPAPAVAPAEGEAVVNEEGDVAPAADAAGDDEPIDVAVAGDIVVATPWPPDTQPVAVPTGTAQSPGDDEQAKTVDAESTADARSLAVPTQAPVHVAPQAHSPVHGAAQPQTTAHAGPPAGIRVSASRANAAMLSGVGIEENSEPGTAVASSDTVPAPAGIEAVAGDAQQVSVPRQARPSAAARAGFGDVIAQPVETVRQGAAPGAAVAAAQSAVAEATTAAASTIAGIETARPQQAEPSAAHGFAMPSLSSAAGQDAPMTGQDQSSGQGRPTPEFMRFAAALAQVSPAASEDAGPAAVAPAAAAPAAASPAAAAPVTTAAVPTSAQTETPGAENVGRLVQAMRVIARPGAWEANVRLNPEHLGDVSIAVRVERNTVSAVVNAEGAGVRQWLESQEEAVRSGMAEHGLQLDRFIVQRDGQRRDAQPQQEQQGRRQAPRRQAVTAERFEVVV